LLAKAFLTRFAAAMNPAVKGFAPDALAAIDGWGWPGNVRELENRVKRAVIMADGKLVALPISTCRPADAAGQPAQPQGRARGGRPQGDPPCPGAQRGQYFQHRAAARHQPAHAL
jgi:DNA-binding NtrC family response regulator